MQPPTTPGFVLPNSLDQVHLPWCPVLLPEVDSSHLLPRVHLCMGLLSPNKALLTPSSDWETGTEVQSNHTAEANWSSVKTGSRNDPTSSSTCSSLSSQSWDPTPLALLLALSSASSPDYTYWWRHSICLPDKLRLVQLAWMSDWD